MIKVLKNTKNFTSLHFKEETPTTVNSIRRSLMRKVDTLAIEDVYITENNSALYDEILAHRLGLIVLHTPNDLVKRSECSCKNKGCAKCLVEYVLKIKGPVTVYAKDLVSNHPKAKPVNTEAVITELLENQELNLKATAELNNGANHTKHSTGLSSHYFKPILKINQKNVTNPKEILDSCPTKVFDIKSGKLEVAKKDNCINCGACVELTNQPEAITLTTDNSDVVLNFENWGQLTNKEVFDKALTNLETEIKTLEI